MSWHHDATIDPRVGDVMSSGANICGTAPMSKSASLTDILYGKLQEDIVSGRMPPGTRLPSQKDIAEQEDVSRTVVREAVSRLEAQGYAIARRGAGVFVSDTAGYRAFQVTRDELSEISDVINLLEMRLAIETEMAGLAANRRTTSDISAMRAALRRMKEQSADPVAAAAADGDFHLAVAHATKNPYYARFIEFLGVRLVPPRTLYLQFQPQDVHDAYALKVRDEHEAVLDAIIRMDADGARQAARRHMQESLLRHSELNDLMAGAEQDGVHAELLT